jgi:hypothetical protein
MVQNAAIQRQMAVQRMRAQTVDEQHVVECPASRQTLVAACQLALGLLRPDGFDPAQLDVLFNS